MKTLIRSAAIALSATALAACGGSSGSSTDTTVAAGAESKKAEFVVADVMFAQMMIPHHEQAVELADIALDPTVGASAAVTDIAKRVKAGQDPEILLMTNLLTGWGQPVEMDMSMDHSDMMSGMLSADELSSLSALRGAAFDRVWMEAMIKHHEGAIDMANDVLKDGSSTQIRDLANAIVSAQQAEITEMRGLLG